MAPLGFMLTHICQIPRLGTKLAVFKLEPVETPHQETTRAPFVQPATYSHLLDDGNGDQHHLSIFPEDSYIRCVCDPVQVLQEGNTERLGQRSCIPAYVDSRPCVDQADLCRVVIANLGPYDLRGA